MSNKKQTPENVIKGFKGFDKDLKCIDKQYQLNTDFEEYNAEICSNGMHFCENPLHIFNYYSPNNARFAEVEGSGIISKKEGEKEDTKVSASKLKIKGELSLHSIINAGVSFIFERATQSNKTENKKDEKIASNSGSRGAASNSGSRGAASNSGYSGAASNSGYSGAASNSGSRGAASNSGDYGAASNSGYSGAASNSGSRGAASNSGSRGAASNSGSRGAASNSGSRGAASNSGDYGAASTIGNYSSAETKGKHSIACGLGYENKVMGDLGTWIVICERKYNGEIIDFQSHKVDGKKVKANTWYKLINKKLTEIK